MLRFILLRRFSDPLTGECLRSHYTVTADVPELEAALSSGGFGEGFDATELVGVEVVSDDPSR